MADESPQPQQHRPSPRRKPAPPGRGRHQRPHHHHPPSSQRGERVPTARIEADEPPIVFNGAGDEEHDGREIINLSELRGMKLDGLLEKATAAGVENANRMRKQDLVFSIVKHNARNGVAIYGEGTLEILSDGFGFLRYSDSSYLSGPGDIYVSPNQIRRLSLRTGDTIRGEVRIPRDNERYFALNKATLVNGSPFGKSKQATLFENLTPYFPTELLGLERPIKAEENITGRIIDLFCPIGKGQRGLLVASPKSGKTVIMQHIAHAAAQTNSPVRQGVIAMQRGALERALDRFDAIVGLAPDFAEGWNKRATVLYMMGRHSDSVADVQHVLHLEPRHYGALSGLGMILLALGREEEALPWLRRALTLNPHLHRIRSLAADLSERLKGKRI